MEEVLEEQEAIFDEQSGVSALDELRHLHESMLLENHLDLEVPRFGGKVLVRYRAPGNKDLAQVINNSDDVKKNLASSSNLLIRSCIGILLVREDGTQQMLTNDHGPIRIGSDLAKVLNEDAGSAREVLSVLFGKDEDASVAINAQAADLMVWAQDRQGQIQEDFLPK